METNTFDYEKNKKRYIDICKSNIHRDGIEKLLDWLDRSDFYNAPASSRYHLACKGGLCQHSLNVYKRLFKEFCNECDINNIDDEKVLETVTIVSLFHDLCKVNFYKEDVRNVKENGVWVQKPYYTIDEKISLGHGEKSVIILQQFMKLTMEEIVSINSHMGFSDNRVKGGDYSIINVWDKYKLALLLHVADLKATKIDEVNM
jgi:hypothetical protein